MRKTFLPRKRFLAFFVGVPISWERKVALFVQVFWLKISGNHPDGERCFFLIIPFHFFPPEALDFTQNCHYFI